jgi:Fur family ferric uptake transcriptional regulator
MKKNYCSHSAHNNSHDHKEGLDRALIRLKSAGYKLTQPRRALLAGIFDIRGPFTADQLSMEVRKKQKAAPTPDLVTVYRSLTSFIEIGLLTQVDFGDGSVRYELKDEGDHHHHHIVCNVCKKIEPIDFCSINGQEQIFSQLGYKDVSHRLEFFGTCPACTRTGL